ncbi:hypothetical protein KKA95_01435 [Patescibacteria group bacterium]|nr:hypothetical protein [Patescibacteria group bacterium]
MRSLATNSSNLDGAPSSDCHIGTVAGQVIEREMFFSMKKFFALLSFQSPYASVSQIFGILSLWVAFLAFSRAKSLSATLDETVFSWTILGDKCDLVNEKNATSF